MPDGDGAGDRIFAAQDHRQRAALGVDAIHHAEPSGERVHLTGALPLEPRDLSAEHLDMLLGLGARRPPPGELALLGREPTLDLLELGQERCLARPRRGGTLPLLFELLLGLLQLSLLGLERVVAARLGGRRDDREQGEDRRERRAAHDSRPARASQPPSPPSNVPAASSATTPTGVKNASCESPSVRLTSGSSRGATSEYVRTSVPSARTAPTRPCIMPWRRSGRRIVTSEAPTSRMISVSWRRAWSTRVVAVVTVRMAAMPRTAPTPRPIVVRSRCQCESCSTQSTLPATSSASGRAARRATSSRAPSGVAAAAAGVTSSDAGSGFAGSWSTTLASLPRTCLSPRSASALRAWGVASTIVVPPDPISLSASRISAAIDSSRFPVGSSARRSGGRLTMARASAARCASPCDSCAG